MKYSNIILLLALAFLVSFSACKKEELSEETITEEEIVPTEVTHSPLVSALVVNGSNDGLDLGCISIDFPFVLIVDGASATINSEEDFETIFMDSLITSIDFEYPLNVTYEDGEVGVVNDAEELGLAFGSCVPDTGWTENYFPAYLICDLNSCYQVVYPLNLINGEEENVVANNEEEFIELLAISGELYFEFPISLTDTDGNVVTAENHEELFQLLDDCNEIIFPGDTTEVWGGVGEFGCYQLGYPVYTINLDGETVVSNDENEFYNALLNGNVLEFSYPLTLIAEDSTVVVVQNEEELFLALFECENGILELDVFTFLANSTLWSGGGGLECYEIVYPFTITDNNGSSIEVNDSQEAIDGADVHPFVEFPVTIILQDNGAIVTVESGLEMFEIISNCE